MAGSIAGSELRPSRPARRRFPTGRAIAALTATASMVLTGQGMAQAFAPAQATPVNAVPSKATPNILDGTVFAMTQVGNTIVVGGSFTQAAQPGTTTAVTNSTNGKYILAFDATTGAINTAFAPGLDGQIETLQPGPTAGTVYAGGDFNYVAGVKAKGLALLNLTNGARITSFAFPAINGIVRTVRKAGTELLVGGTFTTVGGQPRGGLASVNPTTGALDNYLHSTVLTNHNWTPGSTGVAKAAVGVWAMDVSPDNQNMVAIGNFRTVDGLPRVQIATFSLSPTGATVRPDWATSGYEPACYSWAFDTYMRDVQYSPDGKYFVVAATGGGNNTLCDAAARFETAGSGSDVQPSWVDWAGGDSYLSVAVTGSVVYIGGHQRWSNNALGNDNPGGGAVPRPGLVALDPNNGIPLSWNPGRNPRGAGAYALLATPNGLYVGSDTDFIGNNYQYKRMKVAFFPLAGGKAVAATTTPSLPGSLFYGGTPAPRVNPTDVYYRVNAGGPAITASDGGPDWIADDNPSGYENSGSNSAQWGPVQSVDSTVPENTPSEIFNSERWDPGTNGDGGEMHWAFPVPSGQSVDVRLFFANRCSCTAGVGQRQFDVAVDGTQVLNHFDIVAATGGTDIGTMRSYTVTSPGTVTIDFTHEVENPLINGIEIIKSGTTPPPPSSAPLNARTFDGTNAGAPVSVPSDLDWNTVRGPVLIGGQLFYGKSDGTFHKRSFNGQTFGPDQVVDPYDDPLWDNVQTGSGQTFQGTRPDFYGEISRLTSMVYSDGRLYYTLNGSNALYYRAFSPDSGIVFNTESTVPGVTMPAVTGAFLSNGKYWYVDATDGNLYTLGFTPGTVSAPGSLSGSPAKVTTNPPGIDWRARALFLGPATAAAPTPATFIGASSPADTGASSTTATVTIPSGVQAGNLLILNVAGTTAATQTPPAGWTLVKQASPTGVLSTVWQRFATAADTPGSSVTVTFSATQKSEIALLAYSGAGAIDPSVAQAGTAGTSSGPHTAPTVTASAPGSLALWVWNVKSSVVSTLSVPSGTVSRSANSAPATSSGHVTSLLAQSASTVSGTVAGPTATADGSSSTGHTNMFSLVIPPA